MLVETRVTLNMITVLGEKETRKETVHVFVLWIVNEGVHQREILNSRTQLESCQNLISHLLFRCFIDFCLTFSSIFFFLFGMK